MTTIYSERKAKITLLKKLARQHPDWGWEKVQRTVRKELGSSIANVEAHEYIIKARQPKRQRKEKEVSEIEALKKLIAEQNKQLKEQNELLKAELKAKDRQIREQEKRIEALEKKVKKRALPKKEKEKAKPKGKEPVYPFKAIFKARGVNNKPYDTFYSTSLLHRSVWEASSIDKVKSDRELLSLLNKEITNQKRYKGLYTIYNYDFWDYSYAVFYWDAGAEEWRRIGKRVDRAGGKK